MSRRSMATLLTSVRVSALLLVILVVLLILNVALPQEKTMGAGPFHELTDASPASRFFLVTLGLGKMSTSPVFLGVLVLFFLNLLLVLGSRWGSIWRQARLRPRSLQVLQTWMRGDGVLEGALPPQWNLSHVVNTLRGFGYQTRMVGDGALWGVRHRTAAIGFLVFHISFFLLCAGGILIYYTRFVGDVVLTEGQEFSGVYREIRREAPVGGRPQLNFQLLEVKPRFAAGQPLSLEAVFRFRTGAGGEERRSRVNHPAHWGATTVLVQQAGLAPILWLQDSEGYTVDRVAVVAITRGDQPTTVPLADESLEVSIAPMAPGDEFPARADLPVLPVHVVVHRDGSVLFQGELVQGEAALWPGGRLVLEDVGYWLGLQVVSERGGWLLIAGFVMGIVGLIWRLMLYRREMAVVWNDETFSVAGRSEYFSRRFQDELKQLHVTLAGATESPVARPQVTE